MPGQRLANWIVIVVYFTTAVVANRSLVLCREADGGTVIEIAGDHGTCLGSGEPGPGSTRPEHPACRESCCDSCPCDDSSLSVDPARVVKKDPLPSGLGEMSVELLFWPAQPGRPHALPAAPRPHDATAGTRDVTRRSLRVVVLLL